MRSDNMLLLHGNNRYHAKEREYQGTDIVAENTYRAELGLKVYGKSTQNGVPSPESPIPINSIGDSGSVDVVVSDNNGNSQTLTINTPNGLCGIPVDTGGNYTDEKGQQWICDEIDFERGVYIQKIKKDFTTNIDRLIETPDIKGRYAVFNIYKTAYLSGNIKSLSNYWNYKNYSHPQDKTWVGAVSGYSMYISPPKEIDYSVDTLKSYLTPLLPFEVCGILATPIETPLTEEELAAYKAIKSYPYYTHIKSAAELRVKLKEY